MTGCERCNTVNTAKRHVYIVLFKGDDSDFAWNQNIEITLKTEMDLTGFRAKFSFMDFTQEFADITSKKLVLVFPAAATSSFPLGAADASIVLYDSEGKARTIANRIHMIVTKCVDEAYANEDPQAITVSISSSMEREQADWDETDTQSPSYIRNKPEIPTIDATLTQSGEAADAKAVGDALRSGFTEWVCDEISDGWTFVSCEWDTVSEIGTGWFANLANGSITISAFLGGNADSVNLKKEAQGNNPGVELSRHLITPTKTSELTNDSGFITSADVHGDYIEDDDGNKIDADLSFTNPNWTGWRIDGSGELLKGTKVSANDLYMYPDPQEGDEYYQISFDSQTSTWSLYMFYRSGDSWGTERSDTTSGTIDDTTIEFTGWKTLVQETTNKTIATTDNIPTKTSDLTNDGADGSTPYATTAQIPTVPSAYTSTPAMNGVGAAGSSTAWAKGDHVHPTDTSRAAATDLPYRLVEPGKWEFSRVPSRWEITDISYELGDWNLYYSVEGEPDGISTQGAEDALTLTFAYSDEVQITATRASLPGYLLDRAGNRVEVSGDTTLTLPDANPGYLRDFLVRLEISGSTVPSITFAAPTGETTITYETDGDEFPVPDEAGSWLYSFTESCEAHKFAVSLKKVNTVAQGGV